MKTEFRKYIAIIQTMSVESLANSIIYCKDVCMLNYLTTIGLLFTPDDESS